MDNATMLKATMFPAHVCVNASEKKLQRPRVE